MGSPAPKAPFLIGKSWETSSFLKTNLHFENHQKNGIMVGKDSANTQ